MTPVHLADAAVNAVIDARLVAVLGAALVIIVGMLVRLGARAIEREFQLLQTSMSERWSAFEKRMDLHGQTLAQAMRTAEGAHALVQSLQVASDKAAVTAAAVAERLRLVELRVERVETRINTPMETPRLG